MSAPVARPLTLIAALLESLCTNYSSHELLGKLLTVLKPDNVSCIQFVPKRYFRITLKSFDGRQAVFQSGNRDIRKTRRQRQRERHQTKGLMSRTIAVRVHYNSWYISLPSPAGKKCEIKNSALFGERELQRLIFRISIWNWTHS